MTAHQPMETRDLVERWLAARCQVGKVIARYRHSQWALYLDFYRWMHNEGVVSKITRRSFEAESKSNGVEWYVSPRRIVKAMNLRLLAEPRGGSKVCNLRAADRPRRTAQVSAKFENLFSEADQKVRPSVVSLLGSEPHAVPSVAAAIQRGVSVREVDQALCILMPRSQARRILAAAKAEAARTTSPATLEN
jgi:hypothetical protein